MNVSTKKEISQNIVKYLTAIIKASQTSLTKKISQKDKLISLKDFVQTLQEYHTKIREIPLSDTPPFTPPERNELVTQRFNFAVKYQETAEGEADMSMITITDEEIQELMGLLDEAITETNCLHNIPFENDANKFVRLALLTLRNTKDEESEGYDEIQKWIQFFYSFDYAGFDPLIMGRICAGRTPGRVEIYDFKN